MPTGVYVHLRRTPIGRKCHACGKGTLVGKNGWEYWRLNRGTDLVICNSCDAIIWRNKQTNPRRISYGKGVVYLWKNPRTGACQECSRKISDGVIKKTDMHHQLYIPIIPWYGLIELCVSCHDKYRKFHRII